MFEQLTASSAPRERRTMQAVVAVVVHLAVILVALRLTRARAEPARARMLEHSLPPIMRPPAPPATTPARVRPPATASIPPLIPRPAVTVPLPLDLPSRLQSAAAPLRWWGNRPAAGTATPDLNGGAPMSLDSAMNLDQVSAPARYLRGPIPRYPETLRAVGIEGTALLRYIVGTDSLAEPGSVVVIETTRPEFAAPAIEAIRQARFVPATWHGRPVRQVVEQYVRFSIGH